MLKVAAKYMKSAPEQVTSFMGLAAEHGLSPVIDSEEELHSLQEREKINVVALQAIIDTIDRIHAVLLPESDLGCLEEFVTDIRRTVDLEYPKI